MAEDFGFSETELKKFSEAGRTIAAAVGVSVETWARAEAGVILKTWAGKTKVGTEAKARARARLFLARDYRVTSADSNDGRVTINAGVRNRGATIPGVIWARGRNRKFRASGRITDSGGLSFSILHLPNYQWHFMRPIAGAIAGKIAEAIRLAEKSVGLGRQSIVQIADDLGIRLEDVKGGGTLSVAGIAKARAALASNRTAYRNGLGITSRGAQEFYLTLINRYPKIGPMFMDQTLRMVILGRLRYFRRNLEEGTFLSAKAAAKAYPYVEVLRLAA